MKINCYPFFICCTFVYMYNSLLKIYKEWGEGGEKDTHTLDSVKRQVHLLVDCIMGSPREMRKFN